MKKQLLTSVCLFIFGLSLNAQWLEQTSGTTEHLNDLYFTSHESGLVVGDAGTILKTNDGGNLWEPIPSPTNYNLTSIDFSDSVTGFISCDSGYIMKTTDGGFTWNVIETGFQINLVKLQVYESEKIWGCGDKKIIYSNDGGQTWELEFELNSFGNWLSLFALDEDHVWAVDHYYGHDIIYRKDYNIPDWEVIFSAGYSENGGGSVPSIFFADTENGWMIHNTNDISGGGPSIFTKVYFTSNLGDSLECIYTWNWGYQFNQLNDILFVSEEMGWVVGDYGHIYISENAGYDWEQQLCGTEDDLKSVFFTDSINGWVVGENGTILHNFNGAGSSCLSGGISFSTQAQVDSFQVNYPGCTEIGGDVIINGYDIVNLNGLNVLTCIWGHLLITDNSSLPNLTGLNALTSVVGSIRINGNNNLNSLSGLENLTSIGESLYIGGLSSNFSNPVLTTFAGLENLVSIGGDLHIRYSDDLSNLSGLDNVTFIGGNLKIYSNPSLVNLTGLDNVTSIGGYLEIYSNPALMNLTGLDNLTSIGQGLLIADVAITSLAGLDNVTSLGGYLKIYSNPSLVNLTGLDNVNSIGGNIAIGGNGALTSLTGLENITSVGGYLVINFNDALTNLTGLDNLTSIGEYLSIGYNDALTSLTGLENITSVGGYLEINFNDALISIASLDHLVSIGGDLWFWGNDILTSLSGLDNINPGSISNLYIKNNDSLSTCDVESICNYIPAPNGTIVIHDNAPGCNSPEEVIGACETVGVEDSDKNTFTIHPNPTNNGIITITIENNYRNPHMTCFNTYGQQVYMQEVNGTLTVISVTEWPPGIYLAVVYADGKPVGRAKFVIQ